jgi:hypothetical protein
VPDLSPAHAADWHLRQLRLSDSIRVFAQVSGKYEAFMPGRERHPASEVGIRRYLLFCRWESDEISYHLHQDGLARAARHDHLHRAGIIEAMSKSSSRRFPVTITQLLVTRCEICRRTVAYRPGSLTQVLTEHYRRVHPEALSLSSR